MDIISFAKANQALAGLASKRNTADKIVLSDLDSTVTTTFNGTGTIPPLNSVTPAMMTYMKQSVNLFNKNTVIANSYINYSNGNVAAATGYYASDWIPAKPNFQYTRTSDYQMAYYDSSKTKIGGTPNGTGVAQTFTTPANTAYMRITVYPVGNLTNYMIVEGASLPAYDDYYFTVDRNNTTYPVKNLFQVTDLPAKGLSGSAYLTNQTVTANEMSADIGAGTCKHIKCTLTSYENWLPYFYTYDISGVDVTTNYMTVSFDFYTDNTNINQIRTKTWTSSSIDSLGGDEKDGTSITALKGLTTKYSYTATTYHAANTTYLQVLVWPVIASTGIATDYYCKTPTVKIGNTTLTLVKDRLYDSVDSKVYDMSAFPNALIKYYESRPNRLYGKTVNFLGDSLTAGVNATKPFPTIIGERNRMTYNNYGIGGSYVSGTTSGNPNNPMVLRYSSMSASADYIIVFGGTNDFNGGVTMGADNSTDNSTFCGALNNLLSGLIATYPTKKIGFITPMKFNNGTNGIGKYVVDYVDTIIRICANWSVPVLDLYRRGGITPVNSSQASLFTPEGGLHPNDTGHLMMADTIEYFILSL